MFKLRGRRRVLKYLIKALVERTISCVNFSLFKDIRSKFEGMHIQYAKLWKPDRKIMKLKV